MRPLHGTKGVWSEMKLKIMTTGENGYTTHNALVLFLHLNTLFNSVHAVSSQNEKGACCTNFPFPCTSILSS